MHQVLLTELGNVATYPTKQRPGASGTAADHLYSVLDSDTVARLC